MCFPGLGTSGTVLEKNLTSSCGKMKVKESETIKKRGEGKRKEIKSPSVFKMWVGEVSHSVGHSENLSIFKQKPLRRTKLSMQ